MRGLRTQESEKFIRFFELVQAAAAKQGAVFFLESGEGKDFEIEEMEGEELSGWLIEESQAAEFETEFIAWAVSDKWDERTAFCLWKENEDSITVGFELFNLNKFIEETLKDGERNGK